MNIWVAVAISVLLGFVITFSSGFFVIPWLHKSQSGITISPAKALLKQKYTPVMGGILPLAGTVAALAVVLITDKILGGDIAAVDTVDADTEKIKLFSGILMALSFAFVGFFDDYVRVTGKSNAGLSSVQRYVAEIIVMLGYLYSLYMTGATYIFIPFSGNADTGLLFWLLGPAVMHLTMRAVSLSDGADGQCTSMTAVFSVAGIVIALIRGLSGASVLCAVLAGALAGFFVWNRYPSRVRMGSTGSMLLGGMVIAVAYCVNMPWIILFAGAGYAAELAFYGIHVAYYKAKGKRPFKSALLHSHLEKCGLKAGGIAAALSAMNITGAVAAIILIAAGSP